jgi:hypothetical protein
MPAEAVHAVYACPSCRASDSLYEDVMVPGTRSVSATLAPRRDLEIDRHDAESEGTYGCGACEWTGDRRDLLLDGETQARPARGQLTIPTRTPVAPAVLRQVRA